VIITVAVLVPAQPIRPICVRDAAEKLRQRPRGPETSARARTRGRRARQALHREEGRSARDGASAPPCRGRLARPASSDPASSSKLALIRDSPEVRGDWTMKKDIDEMARMRRPYLAFARGRSGRAVGATVWAALPRSSRQIRALTAHASVAFPRSPDVKGEPAAVKRCSPTGLENAARPRRRSRSRHRDHRLALTVTVERGRRPRSSGEAARGCVQAILRSTMSAATRTRAARAGARHRARHCPLDRRESCCRITLGGLRETVRVPVKRRRLLVVGLRSAAAPPRRGPRIAEWAETIEEDGTRRWPPRDERGRG